MDAVDDSSPTVTTPTITFNDRYQATGRPPTSIPNPPRTSDDRAVQDPVPILVAGQRGSCL